MILGIDIGGTTTDIVGFKKGKIIRPLTIKADDPITSAAGALGKYTDQNKFKLSDIKTIGITGVGSSYIESDILGIPVQKVDEFRSIGHGGKFLSGINKAIVVSMGTGTAIVQVNGGKISHWGGSGVGGGTLVGLAKKILNTTDIEIITGKAKKGSLGKVDLTVGDIVNGSINTLPSTVTASNFGKSLDDASENDFALAIINLVCQTIGIIAISAARATNNNDIVLTGKLAILPQAKAIFTGVGKLYNKKFHIPDYSEYSTAIGAAVSVF